VTGGFITQCHPLQLCQNAFMKKTALLFLLSYLFMGGLSAQESNITKKKFHWGRDQDTTAGYTQAILVDNVLYISGTVGRGTTMAEQVQDVYTGLDRTLKHYGLGFQHEVKENLFTTDIEATKAANDVRKQFYKGDFPAATWTQISRLYMPSALVEVEVVAHLPKKGTSGLMTNS
jgi:2-iminobutanoate/2-iminopropanoate deaminase